MLKCNTLSALWARKSSRYLGNAGENLSQMLFVVEESKNLYSPILLFRRPFESIDQYFVNQY